MENKSIVRTRFAPSPTGLLHIGGARTALFNYLWAKHNGGEFLLRFEDTDRERSSVGFEDSMLSDLKWLGVFPDGGIARQTERLPRYQEILSELTDKGRAYPCFCQKDADTCECSNLSASERERLISSNVLFCWKMSVPREAIRISFSDRLRGALSVSADTVEDFVIFRSDGMPTYNLCVVADDHDMGISCVIRGEEHLSNTPKQEIIYTALSWNTPEWVHIPMVLDGERHKLSKRSGAISVSSLRDSGWLPEAVVAYTATLSWSGARGDKIAPLRELAENFDIDSVALDSPTHDPNRMRNFGRMAMSSLPANELLTEFRPLFPVLNTDRDADADREALIRELLPESACIDELKDLLAETFGAPCEERALSVSCGEWFGAIIELLSDMDAPWSCDNIKKALKDFQKENGLKASVFYHTVRFAVTGREHGAPIALIMSCFGREETISRLKKAKNTI